jgi:hypothetical protein
MVDLLILKNGFHCYVIGKYFPLEDDLAR